MSIFWRIGWIQILCVVLHNMLLSSAAVAANMTSQNGHSLPRYQDVELIKSKVTQAIESRLKASGLDHYRIEVQALDGRLRLAHCDQQLNVKPAMGSGSPSGRQSVEVRCTGSKPWKIYLQAHVYAEMDVPVLKYALPAGATISSEHIEMKRIQITNGQPVVRQIDQLLGKKTKRHLNAETPILVSQIEAPYLIRRGQQINLEYELNGLKVRMAGKSHQNGAVGDWIKVVNINSGKVIEGRVNAAGNVSVRH